MSSKAEIPYVDVPIGKFLAKHIDVAASMGITQREIAAALGYDKPTMISMFKRGEVKVPFAKVPALARVLNVDPAVLFRLALQQYWKDDLKVITEIFGEVCTRREREVVQMWRRATKDTDLEPDSDLEKRLQEWSCEKR